MPSPRPGRTRWVRPGVLSHNPQFSAQIPAGWSRAGENVGEGFPTPRAMFDGWMKSPGHRANILGDYTDIGIAFVTLNGRTWGVQDFGKYPGHVGPAVPQPAAPPPAPPPPPARRPACRPPTSASSRRRHRPRLFTSGCSNCRTPATTCEAAVDFTQLTFREGPLCLRLVIVPADASTLALETTEPQPQPLIAVARWSGQAGVKRLKCRKRHPEPPAAHSRWVWIHSRRSFRCNSSGVIYHADRSTAADPAIQPMPQQPVLHNSAIAHKAAGAGKTETRQITWCSSIPTAISLDRDDIVVRKGQFTLVNTRLTPQQSMVEDLLAVRDALDAAGIEYLLVRGVEGHPVVAVDRKRRAALATALAAAFANEPFYLKAGKDAAVLIADGRLSRSSKARVLRLFRPRISCSADCATARPTGSAWSSGTSTKTRSWPRAKMR